MNAFGGETEQGVTYRLIENSVVDPDPYWIRIPELPWSGFVFRIRIHTCKYRIKWETKDARLTNQFTIQRPNWIIISVGDIFLNIFFKDISFLSQKYLFNENCFSHNLISFFLSKLINITLDPDPNSMYLNPQHW